MALPTGVCAFPQSVERAGTTTTIFPAAVETQDGVVLIDTGFPGLTGQIGPMEVVFTPGHAPGHISLSFPGQSLLIAGDALTAGETTLQGPSEQYTLDMDEALNSMRALAARDIDRTLCHHGGFVEDGTDRIAELIE